MQEKVAKEMMRKISKSQADIFKKTFKYFDVFTVVPAFKSLGKGPFFDRSADNYLLFFLTGRQTVNRLRSFIESKPNFLNDIQPDTATSQVRYAE